MCGIISILSNNNIINNILLGLKQLENRGYDSAGIAYLNNDKISIFKKASTKDKDSIDFLSEYSKEISTTCCIAHTRWATHGGKTDINSHPHNSFNNKISLVHNGIIENYLELKNTLLEKDIKFISETDSEIIVNCIAYYYSLTNNPEKSILNTIKILQGTYALCIIFSDYPEKIYCIRKGSPLLLGFNQNNIIITSEVSGFNNFISNYIIIENNDLITLYKDQNKLAYKTSSKYEIIKNSFEEKYLTPYPYEHWLEKEINEQKESIYRAITNGGRINQNIISLGGLNKHIEQIKKLSNIILLGCGTSFYAGLVGINYLKKLNFFNSITCIDGAEFTKYDIPLVGKTGLILLSQSGETRDLYKCIEIAQEENLFMIGIINVIDSMIAREVDCGIYLNAGREVSVASTKSFTSMIVVLSLLSMWLSQIHDLNINNINRINNLRKLNIDIDFILKESQILKKFINKLNHHSMFILGKGIFEAIAKESALKIKEISCIHAEGYSGSSLKHGPFSLLCEGFPIILFIMNDNFKEKMLNVYEEVKARNSYTLVITNIETLSVDNKIIIPNNIYSEILSIVIIQYITFYLGLERNKPIDKPNNLAKCVTTD